MPIPHGPLTADAFTRRHLLNRSALGAAALLLSPAVLAQASSGTFPQRPIQLIVAAPAGGPSDNAARMIAEEMGKILGQPMVVINKPGSGGVIAADATARAAPDGYTLMLSWIGNATSPALVAKLPFDIQQDFVHIVQAMAGANVLVVHPSTGFRTLADLVAHAKANPGRLSYASAGNGTSGHLAMEMFKQRAGISMLHIPYRGGAAALTDLMGGQVQAMFINQDAVIGPAGAGKVVPLAISSAQRNPLFPQLPTVAESGFPGFEATAWAGLSAPRGTPAPVVAAIQAAAQKALAGPLKAKFEATGAQVVASGTEAFTAFVKRETDTWTKVIKTAGIKAD
jgi:tripartite-type tricarboxylate transporter receptor subunit TctC